MNATDRIDYTRPFVEHVQGTLYARFRRDADGAPMYELDGGVRAYTIDVYLHSSQATDITTVSYYLEDEVSEKQLGRSQDRDNDFRATIESAGDAFLLVKVWKGPLGQYEQRAWLSQMLENGSGKDPPAEVKSALLRIKVN